MLPVPTFYGNHVLFVTQIPRIESSKQSKKTCSNRSALTYHFHHPAALISSFCGSIFRFNPAMQKKKNDFQHLGICHRLFNFIMNTLIGRGLKRVTLGHPMPKDSTNRGPPDEYASNGVQEPLIIHVCTPNGEKRMNSRLTDESDSIVQIQFKITEELDYWTPFDKLGSSVLYLAAKDDKTMEKTNEFTEPARKEIPLLNGISVKGKTEERTQGEGSTGPKISIPITKSADQGEEKKREGNILPISYLAASKQPDASKLKLTGLGLNINEISETFIQNTKERLSRNVSLMEAEES